MAAKDLISPGQHPGSGVPIGPIRSAITNWNDKPQPFVWEPADEILDNSAPVAN
jgi:hypothetical protein